MSCFISWFYIKPQQSPWGRWCRMSCFISWFYIKPQLARNCEKSLPVASYLDSTSNHNYLLKSYIINYVASYLDSTSNHNTVADRWSIVWLLHILILHQTTTQRLVNDLVLCCFISWFYIKPQPSSAGTTLPLVASYLDSTSNHNFLPHILIVNLVASYLDSTSNHNRRKGN